VRKKLYAGCHVDIAISLKAASKAYKALGHETKCLDYYNQAYSIYESFNNRYTVKMNKLKIRIEEQWSFLTQRGLSDGNIVMPKREIIISHGLLDEEVVKIKLRLQEKVLNNISLLAEKRTWNKDEHIQSYLEEENLKKCLEEAWDGADSIKIARMLCFESINLGLMRRASSEAVKDKYACSISFLREYRDLIKPLSENHPEYFVDGSIVKCCIEELQTEKFIEHIIKNVKIAEIKSK